VISAGAPVPARVIQTFTQALEQDVQVFTPYGATESLPIACIGSDEILSLTAEQTEKGAGICVGLPVGQTQVRIIGISDEPIDQWSDDLQVSPGRIGEIVVRGPVVSRAYFHRDEGNRLAKITAATNDKPDGFYHRMGDLGYIDDHGRLWMCGRKAHRVITGEGELYTVPCEGIFNACSGVARSALVGVSKEGRTLPAVCIELDGDAGGSVNADSILKALKNRAREFEITRRIDQFLFHPGFPVDIRHNAKINRPALALWAERKLS